MSGHDFSRAGRAMNSRWALAPAPFVFIYLHFCIGLSRNLNWLFAARLKSCPDTIYSQRVILQLLLLIRFPGYPTLATRTKTWRRWGTRRIPATAAEFLPDGSGTGRRRCVRRHADRSRRAGCAPKSWCCGSSGRRQASGASPRNSDFRFCHRR